MKKKSNKKKSITSMNQGIQIMLKSSLKWWFFFIRLMCLSGVTCLPAGCYFTEQALLKSKSVCWSSTKWSSSSHWKTTCSHYIAEKLLSWCQTTITHTLAHFAHTVEPFCVGVKWTILIKVRSLTVTFSYKI
jgi:hypothetical protein